MGGQPSKQVSMCLSAPNPTYIAQQQLQLQLQCPRVSPNWQCSPCFSVGAMTKHSCTSYAARLPNVAARRPSTAMALRGLLIYLNSCCFRRLRVNRLRLHNVLYNTPTTCTIVKPKRGLLEQQLFLATAFVGCL